MAQYGNIIPVLLAGGGGTRLWPVSRQKLPKQFHALTSDKSLLQETLERILFCSDAPPSDVITVTSDALKQETISQIEAVHTDAVENIISEPCSRNTAAAIACAVIHAKKNFDDNALLWITPSDHVIKNTETLKQLVVRASDIAKDGYIVTFGIEPNNPDTGYGYIRRGDSIDGHDGAYHVGQFIEKPPPEQAQDFIANGGHLWNSGMFMASAQTLYDAYQQFCPEIITLIEKDISEAYQSLPVLPFDVAIMEKTDRAAIIPCDIGWSDVGTWDHLWHLQEKDPQGNVLSGNVIVADTTNSFIQSNNVLIAAAGLENIIAVEYHDSILIADRNNKKAMAALSMALKDKKEFTSAPVENRPWGQFKILSNGKNYKAKEITVYPNHQLSLQKHKHRSETWTVTSGTATITIDNETKTLSVGQTAHVPSECWHQLANNEKENLIIVEVQCGNYLEEDDIMRRPSLACAKPVRQSYND